MNEFLGTTEWFDEFYETVEERDLFGSRTQVKKRATCDSIVRYFNTKLATIFAGVAPNPRVLYNSAGCPLYLLCFAVGNPRQAAKDTALRIAGYILDKVD